MNTASTFELRTLPQAPPAKPKPAPARDWTTLQIVFGCLLPAATILIEWTTGMCAESFFDPLPDWRFHLLAWCVPLANLLGLLKVNSPAFGLLNGAAILASIAYAAMFNVLLLPAAFAIPIGIGLLPWSTVFAAWVAIFQRIRLAGARPGPLGGLAFGLAVLAVTGGPLALTQYWLDRAARSEGPERERAIHALRQYGDEGLLRRACDRNGEWTPFFGPRPYMGEVRRIYYEATGKSYLEGPGPRDRWNSNRDWEWDEDLGGARTGRRLKGLRMSSSQFDVKTHRDSGTQYVEWTIEFSNATTQPKEARATMSLPEQGVVSRVTLWVNGEPQEAAFGTRSQTRAAYQSVVAARRDPLLVETAGPGRIRMQCFPVPAEGSMKIRLGITSPANGQLPELLDRNFALVSGSQPPVLTTAPPMAAWTPDPFDSRFAIVHRPLPEARAKNAVLVVDGSASMAPFARRIARPVGIPVIRTGEFRGGTDNVVALRKAHEQLAGVGGGTIVWLHGPQPVELTSAEGLRPLWERNPAGIKLYAAQLVPGPNVVLEKLDGIAAIESARTTAEAWPSLLDARTIIVRERTPVSKLDAELARKPAAPVDVARLWAFDEIRRLYREYRKQAAELAASYRLVTPVSGAVVLENSAQYKAFGLNPDKGLSPVPEPATWILFGTALVLLCVLRRRIRTS